MERYITVGVRSRVNTCLLSPHTLAVLVESSCPEVLAFVFPLTVRTRGYSHSTWLGLDHDEERGEVPR